MHACFSTNEETQQVEQKRKHDPETRRKGGRCSFDLQSKQCAEGTGLTGKAMFQLHRPQMASADLQAQDSNHDTQEGVQARPLTDLDSGDGTGL